MMTHSGNILMETMCSKIKMSLIYTGLTVAMFILFAVVFLVGLTNDIFIKLNKTKDY